MGRQYDGVRPASSSTIEIDFYYAGRRCRERIKLKPTPTNLRRAANHRAAILDAIEKGVFSYVDTFPNSKNALFFTEKKQTKRLDDYLEKWLSSKKQSIKASSFEGYQKIIRYTLNPYLGAIELQALKRKDIRDMCEQTQASNKRISNILSVLRSALTDAVTDDFIDTNPLSGWTYKRNEAPKEGDDVDPFTLEEQALITSRMPPQGKNLIQFAFWTGLRTSELVALRWGDVDFNRNEIRVRRATTQAAKQQAETTKTRSGNRTVKLLTPALEALLDQKPFTYLANEQVFHNPRTNRPWVGDQPIRRTLWQPALKAAGVRYRNPYQTRHTYASMMLSAGEHPMWVAAQMGHSDWGMIRRIYGKWMPDAAPDAGNKVEALFSNQLQSLQKSR